MNLIEMDIAFSCSCVFAMIWFLPSYFYLEKKTGFRCATKNDVFMIIAFLLIGPILIFCSKLKAGYSGFIELPTKTQLDKQIVDLVRLKNTEQILSEENIAYIRK